MPERRRRNRITRRLTVFGPALIVILTGILAYGMLRRVLETRRLVLHTRDVLDASSGLLTSMLDAETGQRGYLLTHDTAFLVPFRGAPQRAESSLTRLRGLSRDNPRQQARLDTLDQKVKRRLGVLDSTILAESQGRTDLARGILQFGPGRSLMTDIRRLVDSVRAEEERLLAVREGSESQSTRFSELTMLLGTLLAGLLAFIVNRNLDAALRDRRKANEGLKLQTERAERLQSATEAFTSALSLEEVGNSIVDHTMSALGATSGGLAVIEGDGMRFVAIRNVEGVDVGVTFSRAAPLPVPTAVRERSPVVLSTAEEIRQRFPDIVETHRPDGVQAIAVYPLILDDAVLGGLIVRWDTPHQLTPADDSFMRAMSRIAAETLDRARLFEAERSARSEAEAANRAKAAFLASMSHELRTPLQAALGFAQLMRSGMYGEINEQQAEVLTRVERSQSHLARLIDDILDFARLEAGRVRMTKEHIRVIDVINDLAPLVEPQAAAKKIDLLLLPPPATLTAVGDRHRLQQILVNIVGNAIKFTPELGTIRVGALCEDDRAVITVQDSGIGIPPDRLQAIFDPFVQVDSGLTRTTAGAGLGLAISRDLARAMGGDIRCESEIGKGSTFYVSMPLATGDGRLATGEGN